MTEKFPQCGLGEPSRWGDSITLASIVLHDPSQAILAGTYCERCPLQYGKMIQCTQIIGTVYSENKVNTANVGTALLMVSLQKLMNAVRVVSEIQGLPDPNENFQLTPDILMLFLKLFQTPCSKVITTPDKNIA